MSQMQGAKDERMVQNVPVWRNSPVKEHLQAAGATPQMTHYDTPSLIGQFFLTIVLPFAW